MEMTKTKWALITCLLLVCLAVLALTLPGMRSRPKADITDSKESKKTSDFALVFVANGFQNKSKFGQFQRMLVNGSGLSLFSVKPFKQFKNNITIRSVFKRGSFCQPGGGCNYKQLEQEVRQASPTPLPPRLRLIVLCQQKFMTYALYSYQNNSALFLPVKNRYQVKRNHTLQREFLHELGHLFGLKDERGRKNFSLEVEERNGRPDSPYLPGKPNCARNLTQAKRWWGDIAAANDDVGFFKGCAGNKRWIRPHENSLMRSPYQNVAGYGRVNENYLRQLLLCTYLKTNRSACNSFSPE